MRVDVDLMTQGQNFRPDVIFRLPIFVVYIVSIRPGKTRCRIKSFIFTRLLYRAIIPQAKRICKSGMGFDATVLDGMLPFHFLTFCYVPGRGVDKGTAWCYTFFIMKINLHM